MFFFHILINVFLLSNVLFNEKNAYRMSHERPQEVPLFHANGVEKAHNADVAANDEDVARKLDAR